MRNRMAILAGAVTVGLLITGIAFAAQDVDEGARTEVEDNSGSTSTTGVTSSTGSTLPNSTSPTPTTATNDASNLVLAEGQVSQVPVADAGTVLLRRSGGSLTIVSTQSNPGWVVEVEVATGREVEGDFRNGSRRVKFNFELEDGFIRVRIESESDSSGGSLTSTTNGSGSSTSTTNTTNSSTTTGGSSLPTGSITYNLDGAGTVTVMFANGGMTIGSINPAPGWTTEKSEQESDEIEVELINGDAEAELKVKINNGVLDVKIDSTTS